MSDKATRALVVEDDPSWRQLLSEILSDSGLEVDVSSSYTEAVEALRRQPHRLAVLDLSLGGTDHHNQDGLQVAAAVRRLDPACVVLFLTGFATVELAVQVMQELGAYTCLRKEAFRRSEFRKVISQALAQAPLAVGKPTALVDGGEPDDAAPVRSGAQKAPPAGQVLIIEDDAGWRDLLSEILGEAGYGIRLSASYVESAGLIKREHYDLAVVDLSLASSLSQENMDGYRLLAGLQKFNIPVIIVSGYADPVRIEQAYSEKLIFACLEKQAFDRKGFLQTAQSAINSPAEDPILRSLTEREREVLVLLARGLTNKEIGQKLVITPNTVKRHLKSLFIKLGINTRSAASAMAIGMGLGEKK